RGFTVAAVADVAREAALARLLERGDDVAPAKLGQRAAVELDQVEMIGAEALQTALDALEERLRPPVGAPAGAVAALSEEVDSTPTAAHRLPDQDLAVVVALGGVDDVQAGIERAAQEARHRGARRVLIADLGAAEAEHAHDHVGVAESSPLHGD